MLWAMRLLALVTQLLEWLRPFFETYGYVIVSVAMFFESAAFTGILVPGDVILAIGGVYAGQGELSLAGVIACGAFFGVLGTSAGYLLGRRYGDGLLRRAPILRRFEDRVTQAQASIAANAGKTIVLGRFVTGAAVFVPFVAGSSGVRPLKFFAYAIPTMVLWATGLAAPRLRRRQQRRDDRSDHHPDRPRRPRAGGPAHRVLDLAPPSRARRRGDVLVPAVLGRRRRSGARRTGSGSRPSPCAAPRCPRHRPGGLP